MKKSFLITVEVDDGQFCNEKTMFKAVMEGGSTQLLDEGISGASIMPVEVKPSEQGKNEIKEEA